MVTNCSSCKTKYTKGCGITFFRFPRNEFLRTEWLKACGFDLHPKNDTSKMKLCSKHFQESCFRVTTIEGPLILNSNSIPTLFPRKKTRNTKPVSNIKVLDAEAINQSVNRQLFVAEGSTAESITNKSEKKQIYYTIESQTVNTSQKSEISSSANSQQISIVADQDHIARNRKKRQICEPRPVMEMSLRHFSTPRKAQRNLMIIKHNIKKRDMRIKQLIQKTYRMRKKIESLEHFIEHLQSKEFVYVKMENNL